MEEDGMAQLVQSIRDGSPVPPVDPVDETDSQLSKVFRRLETLDPRDQRHLQIRQAVTIPSPSQTSAVWSSRLEVWWKSMQ